MNDFEQQKQVIKQYLLGELTEERQESVEERLMSDREYRDEVLIVESELVEDYLTETLATGERGKFEKYYLLAPRQQQNVKLTKALLKAARSAKPLPAKKNNLIATFRNFFQWSTPRQRFATSSIVLLVVVGLGIVFYAWRLRVEQAQLRAELAQLNTAQNIRSADGSVASVMLVPVNLRDRGALPRVTVTPATQVVQLRLPDATNTYQRYRVELRTIEGDQIVEFDAEAPAPGTPLILQLPARLLKPDDYVLTVNGQGDYSFRVLEQ